MTTTETTNRIAARVEFTEAIDVVARVHVLAGLIETGHELAITGVVESGQGQEHVDGLVGMFTEGVRFTHPTAPFRLLDTGEFVEVVVPTLEVVEVFPR